MGSVQESITVAGGALVETTKAEVSTVVTQQQIATLPIEGRSAITLALLRPAPAPTRRAPSGPAPVSASAAISSPAPTTSSTA